MAVITIEEQMRWKKLCIKFLWEHNPMRQKPGAVYEKRTIH